MAKKTVSPKVQPLEKPSKKKIVLIIGSKGMLGQELVSVFKRDSDYAVTAWDRKDIDVTVEKTLKEKIQELEPSIIINATGYNAVDKCEEDKQEYELAKKLNGQAPGYLAKAAKKIGAVFVTYSSDYVFDGQPEIPEPAGCTHSCGSCGLHQNFVPQIGFDEEAETNPLSNYGKSKVLGEKAVQKYGQDYYIIRLSWLFGKPGASEGSKKSFFAMMLELGKKNKEVKGVDDETSCFTYAPDLAKKTKELVESKKPSGIYHITNGGPSSWYEGVLELYRQAKLKTKVIPVSGAEFLRPAKRPYYSVLLNTKLNPLRGYKDALKEYLKNNK